MQLHGEDNCPADAVIYDFRIRAHKMVDYPKNIEFSKESIDFFRKMADIVEESENNICFKWYEVPEQDLLPLIVKLRKSKGKFLMQYIKEIGEKGVEIKGKQRKGKNINGKIKVIKQIEEDEGER